MKNPRSVIVRTFALSVMGLGLFTLVPTVSAVGRTRYVENAHHNGDFPIVQNKMAATVVVAGNEYPGVIRAAGDLRLDVERVTGVAPNLVPQRKGLGSNTIVIGTIGKSETIDRLVGEGKIDVSSITWKLESF